MKVSVFRDHIWLGFRLLLAESMVVTVPYFIHTSRLLGMEWHKRILKLKIYHEVVVRIPTDYHKATDKQQ